MQRDLPNACFKIVTTASPDRSVTVHFEVPSDDGVSPPAQKTACSSGPAVDAPPQKPPQFAPGEIVSAICPDNQGKLGVILSRYPLYAAWRYVLQCDDDSEAVLFEFELVPYPIR